MVLTFRSPSYRPGKDKRLMLLPHKPSFSIAFRPMVPLLREHTKEVKFNRKTSKAPRKTSTPTEHLVDFSTAPI